MSENRASVYRAICDSCERDGYSPTVREIALQLGLAVATVQWHVEMLIDEGMLTRNALAARTLRPVHTV